MKTSVFSTRDYFYKIILILFLIPIPGFNQNAVHKERIEWRGEKLKWSDYKASPDQLSPQAAVTSSGVEYKLNTKNDAINLEVICYFRPDLSWVKKPTDYLLGHEQLHFDITEYYKRKFEQEAMLLVRKSSAKDFQKLKTDIAKLYQVKMNELYMEQDLYDEETNSSKNLQMQEKWRKKYNGLLNVKF